MRPVLPAAEYDRMRENRKAIRSVSCPHCGAVRGALCVGPTGKPLGFHHQARRHAAAEAGVYVP